MKYEKSYALKLLKKEMGQANHFLITILVGLDGVKSGKVVKNEEFDVAWNPRSVESSASRSRIYAIKSSLAWAVDCLDMYFLLCNKKPKLLSDELSRAFDGTGHSVYKKFEVITNSIKMDELEKACIDLLICWRNRSTHYFAENDLKESSRKTLVELVPLDSGAVKCHLEVDVMLKSFDDGEIPAFKEVAFLIRKTISFVEHLDAELLSKKQALQILDDLLCINLKQDGNIFEGIFQKKDSERRKHKLVQFFANIGFTDLNSLSIEEEKYIQALVRMSFREAKEKIKNGSFL